MMHPLLNLLLETPQRQIYHLQTNTKIQPAVFLLHDKEIGGVLINTPDFTQDTQVLLKQYQINYIFLPSHFGAVDVTQWRSFIGAKLLAHEEACHLISTHIDYPVNEKTKLTRTIDFLPISGRSPGCCALFLKNLPGIIFFGPALQCTSNGWPGVIQLADDLNFEARLFSSLNLKDLKYQYAFTDNFNTNNCHTGPDADRWIKKNIEALFD